MSLRSRLEDKYKVVCPKCKKEWVNLSKTPNQIHSICADCEFWGNWQEYVNSCAVDMRNKD